ncbi:MAG: UTP--glucose-1-phosphate uridylyltransferase [Candidatus Berkelbacteria bacterium]|nr:UTP--glucose-1-phosphate uridylyltransferase [Candidatus Berkelbacteria bacterium]
MKVTKAIVPVAGYGTRFLPVVKTIPKEMLPILNKPVIQLIVENLVAAGIKTIVLVTSSSKKAVDDYFDSHFELENKLKEAGKDKELNEIKRVARLADIIYVRQKEIRGNGDAILCAKEAIGDEPFIVTWGDGFSYLNGNNEFKEIIKEYKKYHSIIMSGYITDKKEDTNKYGYIRGKKLKDGMVKVEKIIEKPGPENAPSNIAIVSGFLFTPDLFDALESIKVPEGKELVYVDGLNYLMQKGKDVYVKPMRSVYYDCGNILDWLKTNVDFALKREDIKDEFKKYLQEKLKQ